MSVQVNVSGICQGNDILLAATLTYQGNPLDLTTITSVTGYLKQDATELDSSGKTYTTASGITYTNPSQGGLTLLIPRTDVGANRWYRFDIVDAASHLFTAVFGRLIIQDV